MGAKTGAEDLESMLDNANQVLDGEPKDEGGATGQDVSRASNSQEPNSPKWLTSLPSEFREEARDCANLTEYLKKLKSAKDTAEVAKDTEETWESLYDSIGATEEGSASRKLADELRNSGLDSESTRKAFVAYSKGEADKVAERELLKGELIDKVFTAGRKSDKSFDASVSNGMKAFAARNPEMFKRARDTGIATTPREL